MKLKLANADINRACRRVVQYCRLVACRMGEDKETRS